MVLAANEAATLHRRDILGALRALKRGDFSVRLPDNLTDIDGEIASTFNEVVELNDSMAREFERLNAMVGRDGKLAERARLYGATGSWAKCVDSINGLVSDMAFPVRSSPQPPVCREHASDDRDVTP